MPRKSDPAVGILRYFEEAPIDAASMLFGLVRDVVRRRTPVAPKKRAKRAHTTIAQAHEARQTQADPAPAAAKPPRTRKPKDVPLPGPVSTVGDE